MGLLPRRTYKHQEIEGRRCKRQPYAARDNHVVRPWGVGWGTEGGMGKMRRTRRMRKEDEGKHGEEGVEREKVEWVDIEVWESEDGVWEVGWCVGVPGYLGQSGGPQET